MYNSNIIYSFVSNVLCNNNLNINITEKKILANSISRLDVLLPAPIKTALKEISKATKTTMTDLVIRAIVEYFQNFNISETDMDIITVKRSEYLETIEKIRELDDKIKEMSKIEKEQNKITSEIEELKRKLKEEERKNKELEKENKKLKRKIEKYEKKDPILKLETLLNESPELPLTEAFNHLNLTHVNDRSKFINNNIKHSNELSTKYLKVYSFLDDRLSNYIIVTENGLYDGRIILKSNLNNELAKKYKEIEEQRKLERLKQKMKEYRHPLETELLKIKNNHPELSDTILDYFGKISRIESPQKLIDIIIEIKNWLKQYSITLSEKVIEEMINNMKTEQLNNNEKWRQRLR